MDFEIKILTTNEYQLGKYSTVDLVDLENFIKTRLRDKNYGESVIKFFWGFELYKFDGTFAQFFSNDITSWKHSSKWLVSNSHFDWNVLNDLPKRESIIAIKSEILNSIKRIGNMKKKPKSFDYNTFYVDLDVIMDEYLKENNAT